MAGLIYAAIMSPGGCVAAGDGRLPRHPTRPVAVICEDIERSGWNTVNALKPERNLADAGIPLAARLDVISCDYRCP